MKRILFDTNILIPYLRSPEAFSPLQCNADAIFTPTMNISITFRG